MTIIKRRSPWLFAGSSVFAVFSICLIIGTEMAAAWKRDMCIPGDVYIDTTNEHHAKGCKFCENWCIEECSDLDLPAVSYGCRDGGDLRCRCCCGKSSPVSSPPSPPTLLALPISEFDGSTWPHEFDICKQEEQEKIFRIKHKDGRHCINKPSCEESCRKEGLWTTRAECVGRGFAYPNPSYQWFEQCCCGKSKPPPPPPPPSSPPPSLSPPPPPLLQSCTDVSVSELCRSCIATQPKPSSRSPSPPSSPSQSQSAPSPSSPSVPLPASPPPTPKNMCKPKDIYLTFNSCGCDTCLSECRTKCSVMNGSLAVQRCTIENSSQLCECCCKSDTPSGCCSSGREWRYAKDFYFKNLSFDTVSNPACPPQKTAVQIKNVTYEHFTGTSATQAAVVFHCSQDIIPCTELTFDAIQLSPAKRGETVKSVCINAHGERAGLLQPKIPCLLN